MSYEAVVSILARERAAHTQHIWTYKKRREQKREELGFHSKEYKEWIKGNHKALDRLYKRVKVIDANTKKCKALCEKVEIFIGSNPRSKGQTQLKVFSRGIYYKWGMEHGISGKFLRKYIGQENIQAPSRERRRLMKVMKADLERRDIWRRFKVFMEAPNQLG